MDIRDLIIPLFVGGLIFGVVATIRQRRAGKDAVRKVLLKVKKRFANPGDFMSDFDLETEYRRRVNRDPAGFAQRVATRVSWASSLAAAVLDERSRAVQRPMTPHDIGRHDDAGQAVFESIRPIGLNSPAHERGEHSAATLAAFGFPNGLGLSWIRTDPFMDEPTGHNDHRHHDNDRIRGIDAG